MEDNNSNQKRLQKILEDNAKKMASRAASYATFVSAFKTWHQDNHLLQEENKNKQKNYLNRLEVFLEKRTGQEGLNFLQKEKRGFEVKIIKSNISENGYEKKFYQAVIDKILEPLINIQIEIVQQEKQISTLTLIEDNTSDTAIQKSENQVLEPSDQKLPDGFRQIECDASESQIMECFNILTKEINQAYNEPHMTAEDVEFLVEKNFKIFEKEPKGGFVKINLGKQQKIRLRHFLYQFYEKYAAIQNRPKKDYANFLIWNFELFRYEKVDVLVNNMGPSKAPTGANKIPVEKYLKG